MAARTCSALSSTRHAPASPISAAKASAKSSADAPGAIGAPVAVIAAASDAVGVGGRQGDEHRRDVHLANHLDRQPGLAHAAGADQRDQPRPLHRGLELTPLVETTDERRDDGGQATAEPPSRERSRRWRAASHRHPVLEDLLFGRAQLVRRVQPELVDQPAPGRRGNGEHVGLAALAVEADHQVDGGVLAPWFGVDERLQFHDGGGDVAMADGQAETVLTRLHPLLVQTQRRRLDPGDLGHDIGQCPTPPQRFGGLEGGRAAPSGSSPLDVAASATRSSNAVTSTLARSATSR